MAVCVFLCCCCFWIYSPAYPQYILNTKKKTRTRNGRYIYNNIPDDKHIPLHTYTFGIFPSFIYGAVMCYIHSIFVGILPCNKYIVCTELKMQRITANKNFKLPGERTNDKYKRYTTSKKLSYINTDTHNIESS